LEKSEWGKKLYLFNDRASADYIYDRETLANLHGSKLQPKRNHVNKFEKSNDNIESFSAVVKSHTPLENFIKKPLYRSVRGIAAGVLPNKRCCFHCYRKNLRESC
jgi:hypothetical protein